MPEIQQLDTEMFVPQPHSPCEDLMSSLRRIGALEGLTEEEFRWLARNSEEITAEDGQILFRTGEPLEHLTFLLEGSIHVRRPGAGSLGFFVSRAGQLTGKLPYSRMKVAGFDGFAAGHTRALFLHQSKFPEMLAAIPSMAQRSVSVLLDRVREMTRVEQQADKLAALGKLAANLSHELKNPASAARSAATTLSAELRNYGRQKFLLGSLCLSEEHQAAYRAWAGSIEALLTTAAPPSSDSIVVSAREDLFTAWLETHKIAEPWTIAPTLAETSLDISHLESLAAALPAAALPTALASFVSGMRAERMTDTVVDATARIFDLISAIQDYSYMDQAPIQELELTQSLESTLAMFSSRIAGIYVERDYAPVLPPVTAYGSELNQVWTELIENAIDAMDGQGTLTLRAKVSGGAFLVEICDTGHGIPSEALPRIFEPFFTTKSLGVGLGLGLDNASRIVSKHGGSLTVTSNPGDTCFQVHLPLEGTGTY
jgi:signal transduction histidine kinase